MVSTLPKIPGHGFFLLSQTFRNERRPWGKTRLWLKLFGSQSRYRLLGSLTDLRGCAGPAGLPQRR